MRFLVLHRFLPTVDLIVSVITVVVVPPIKDETLKRISASVLAMGTVAVIASGKAASRAAKDVHPAFIFTYLTMPWIRCGFPTFINEIVVVAADLQSLPDIYQLLLARAPVRCKTSVGAASCTHAQASNGTYLDSILVVVPTVTVFPFCPTAIAKLCVAATTARLSVAKGTRFKLCRSHLM